MTGTSSSNNRNNDRSRSPKRSDDGPSDDFSLNQDFASSDYQSHGGIAPPPPPPGGQGGQQQRRERRRKNKWGDENNNDGSPDNNSNNNTNTTSSTADSAPDWVLEAVQQPAALAPEIIANNPALAKHQQQLAQAQGQNLTLNINGALVPGGNGALLASNQISKEMQIPSAVMGHIIGPKGATVSQFRSSTGVHVQVISNPTMPFGKLQIGPGPLDAVDKCVELVNTKLLDYVARGQAQSQATGLPPSIPPTMIDAAGNFVPIVATDIDAAAQLAELQDLGPSYPGGIIKELTIPSNLMGGIIGPRQSTLSQIRKAAKCRIEIASQPKVGSVTEGVLRVGPAPPDIVSKCEELIQIKSEELLGQRARSNPLSFALAASSIAQGLDPRQAAAELALKQQNRNNNNNNNNNSGGTAGGANLQNQPLPPGMELAEVPIPKEVMGAVIGAQGTGIERIKQSLISAGLTGSSMIAISISDNPARDPSLLVGKIKLGPGTPENLAIAVRICEERVNEVKMMREQGKQGQGKGGGGGGNNMGGNNNNNMGGNMGGMMGNNNMMGGMMGNNMGMMGGNNMMGGMNPSPYSNYGKNNNQMGNGGGIMGNNNMNNQMNQMNQMQNQMNQMNQMANQMNGMMGNNINNNMMGNNQMGQMGNTNQMGQMGGMGMGGMMGQNNNGAMMNPMMPMMPMMMGAAMGAMMANNQGGGDKK